MPTVSVILPTYNSAHFIGAAIESVLVQSFQDFELLILDDGSTDHTATAVAPYLLADNRVQLLRQEHNEGLQKTLNRGLRAATGEMIARIDADDMWCEKEKLASQVSYLKQHDDCVLVGTGVIAVDASDVEQYRYLNPEHDCDIRAQFLAKNCFAHPSVLFRRQIGTHSVFYSEQTGHRHIEDYELWLQLGQYGTLSNIPLYALRYRISGSQISSRHRVEQVRKTIALAKQYRGVYPHFWRALVRHYIRLVVYGYLRLDSLRSWTAYLYHV
jgi:glycosyltransferase involved in cell wall biosynthesis